MNVLETQTPLAPNKTENETRADGGVTPRVVILCLLLAVFFGWVLPIVDMKFSNTYLGAQALPMGAVAALAAMLLIVNPLLRVLGRAFTRNETLTVYISCLFSCLVPGHGAEHYFVPNTVGAFYYATQENGWLAFLKPYLPSWFSPALYADGGKYGEAGRKVAEGWYVGAHGAVPWGAWIVPIAAWTALILVSYFMWACLAVLLRAQWAQREALAFPLLRLPLEMTADTDKNNAPVLSAFFRNPLMWVGFGVAVFIQGLNGLHLYFPDVPNFPLSLDTSGLLTEAPWNQIGPVFILIYPVVIGITYLLTAEISFSLWFFFLFFKLQYVAAYYVGYMPATLPDAIGWAGPAPKTFAGFEQLGAYIVYVAAMFWTGREHFKHVARRAFGRTASTREEKSEAMSYPLAFWGFFLSFAFIVAWSMAAGMRWDIALAMWLFYVMCVIVVTRIVVESGMLYVQQGFTPLGTFAQLTGGGQGAWLTQSSLVPASFLQMSMIIDLRANLMPSFLQGFKLAKDQGIRARPLLALIFTVILITFALGVYQSISLGYQSAGLGFQGWYAQASPQWSASITKQLSQEVPGTSGYNWLWTIAGGVLAYTLMLARSRLLWFPLHPIGLLMGLTSPMFTFGFSVFLGWLCKVTITRMGGNESYRKLIPMFLGLALGDIAMMVFWICIDGWQGRVGHQLLPG